MSNPILVAPDAQVDRLLSKLSLKQKIGQMTQLTITSVLKTDENNKCIRPFQLADPQIFSKYQVGSLLNTPVDDITPMEWRELIQFLQAQALKTQHKIPLLYGIDSIHGQ